MSWRWLLPLGLISLAVGLVINVPAAWVAQQVQTRVPAVKLAGVTGSAYDGRAQYVVADGAVLEGVEWQLRPAALLTGRLVADLAVDTDAGRLRATVARGLGATTRITGAEGTASIGWFGRLAGYPQLPLSGDIRADLPEAEIGDDRQVRRVQGTVQLVNARWQLAKPPIDLGSFGGELKTEGDAVVLETANSDGPLDVDGSARLVGGNRYRLDMTIRPRAGADERLKSMLDLLGRPDAEGAYRVRERGAF